MLQQHTGFAIYPHNNEWAHLAIYPLITATEERQHSSRSFDSRQTSLRKDSAAAAAKLSLFRRLSHFHAVVQTAGCADSTPETPTTRMCLRINLVARCKYFAIFRHQRVDRATEMMLLVDRHITQLVVALVRTADAGDGEWNNRCYTPITIRAERSRNQGPEPV